MILSAYRRRITGILFLSRSFPVRARFQDLLFVKEHKFLSQQGDGCSGASC